MKKYCCLTFAILISFLYGFSQKEISIIPQPNKVVIGEGSFPLTNETIIIVTDKKLLGATELFNQTVKKLAGFELKVSTAKPAKGKPYILLTKDPKGGQPESYSMVVSPQQVTISGASETGIFYGLNNIVFMLEKSKQPNTFSIPACTITDGPRFAYRGMMLDVSRHFRSVEYLKQHLDRMAMLKFNVFHWHLTDDQGWRIEIKKYPKLTEIGAWRDGTIIGGYPGTGNDNQRHGGFYTQEQVKEIVAYAAKRNITVVPEIEMPGHSSAAIAAYPWLSCFPEEETFILKHPSVGAMQKKGKKVQETFGVFDDVYAPTEETFKFLEDVIDEVVPLFPGKYIHVGGDECPKEYWKRSAFCQNLIREKGLKDEHGLQSYFIQRMEKYINKKGKQIIGWDEILEGGLAPNATVMSWRGESGGIEAAKQNHEVIMTPTDYCYFDYSQTKNEDSVVIGGYLPLERVYQYNPVPKAIAGTPFEKMVLGAQANLWTEYIRSDSKLEYMVYPRLAAMSENIWTRQENKSWDVFQKKLPTFFGLLDGLGVNYSRAFYEIETGILPNSKNDGVLWSLETRLPNAEIFVQTPGSSAPVKYTGPVAVTQPGNYNAFIRKDGKDGMWVSQEFAFHKAVGRPITLTYSPAPKYKGNGGPQGLVNGAISKGGLKSAEWVGLEGADLEAVIDLGSSTNINSVKVALYESEGSWIYRPTAFEVFVSDDNKNYTLAGKAKNEELTAPELPRFLTIDSFQPNSSPQARYVKVVLKNHGTIPSGKPGAGHKAWLFVDEIEIN